MKMKKNYPIIIWLAVSLSFTSLLLWVANTNKEEQYIAAVTGSLLGGVIAFLIARWQLHKEQNVENNRNKELVKIIIKQVALEVRDNKNRLKKLEAALYGADLSDKRTWEYAYAITKGLGSGSYDMLMRSGLAPYVDVKDMQILYECYSLQAGVISMNREAHALSVYTPNGKKEEAELDLAGKNAATNVRTVSSQFNNKLVKSFLKRHLS